MAIQVRLESNPLTTPHSYSLRFVPIRSASREDIAADIALRHPNFSKEDIQTILNTKDEVILLRILNGEQVTEEGFCTWFPSVSGKLINPDDQTPPLDQYFHLHGRVSSAYVERARQQAHIERLPMTEKLPVITSAEDTVLGLKDVLRADGMLRITGTNLFFDRKDGQPHCLIEGSNNGSAAQTRVGQVTNSEITLLPDVPSQTQPWHNEYRLSITTTYTENGTPRTGIYKRMLRTMLGVRIGDDPGILSSSGTVPLVTVTGGTLAAEGARLRIQVVLDAQDGDLRFSLLDMEEGGKAGDDVRVAANGVYTLPGWTGCDVTSMEVTVADYAGLLAMVRSPYAGRLVDILDVSMGS
jgi:hypothetical protein